MKTSLLLSAVFTAVLACPLSAATITVAAGKAVRPTKALTGGVLVKEGPGILDLSTVPLLNDGLVIREGTVRFSAFAKGAPTQVKTRHLRWTITGTRPNAKYSGSGPQFSEFRLFYKGQPVAIPPTTTSTSVGHDDAEGADKGFDGNLRTKCYKATPFILDFGTEVTFDAYSFATANDAPGRDPRDWTLEIGSKQNGKIRWGMVAAEQGFEAPLKRFAEAGKRFPLAPGGAFSADYPIEVCGKGRLQLDGIGGRLYNVSGNGLIELSRSALVVPPESKFTGSVVGGNVTYEKKRLF